MKAAYHSTSSTQGKKKKIYLLISGLALATGVLTAFYLFAPTFGAGLVPDLFMETIKEGVAQWIVFLAELLCGRCATLQLGGMEQESPSRSAEETSPAGNIVHMMNPGGKKDFDLPREPQPQQAIVNVPPLALDLNQPAEHNLEVRRIACEIREKRVTEEYRRFIQRKAHKQLFSSLCAYEGNTSTDQIIRKHIQGFLAQLDSTTQGLISFVNDTNDPENRKRILSDHFKSHFENEQMTLEREEEARKAWEAKEKEEEE